MIAPHELKNKAFTRVVRGYNPVEVDQYFDFLIEKYTEAYKAASDLEQKYNALFAKYSELSNEEESIRSAILKAQKLGEAIVNNAEREAKEKEQELVDRCNQIVSVAKDKVQAEKENILKLRKQAMDFQHQLYEQYVQHVEMIRSMDLDTMPDPDAILNDEAAFKDAVEETMEGKDFDLIIPSENQEQSNESIQK